MPYQRAFSTAWPEVLRVDGVWRTDPGPAGVTAYRFCRDLRVMAVTVPAGRLLDTVGDWFVPSESRVDDGRTVYAFSFGTFGIDAPHVIAEWPTLSRAGVLDRFWSRGTVAGTSLSWTHTAWTGRRRPRGFQPPSIAEQARFHEVDRW
jgi:hypothetical protein